MTYAKKYCCDEELIWTSLFSIRHNKCSSAVNRTSFLTGNISELRKSVDMFLDYYEIIFV